MGDSNKIEGLLKDNPQGLTIQELSDQTGLHRTTVKNILSNLEGAGKITVREVGQAKIHNWILEKKWSKV